MYNLLKILNIAFTNLLGCTCWLLLKSPILYWLDFYNIYKEDGVYHVVIGFCLVSLFNGISTFVGYLMPKPLSEKNSSGTI